MFVCVAFSWFALNWWNCYMLWMRLTLLGFSSSWFIVDHATWMFCTMVSFMPVLIVVRVVWMLVCSLFVVLGLLSCCLLRLTWRVAYLFTLCLWEGLYRITMAIRVSYSGVCNYLVFIPRDVILGLENAWVYLCVSGVFVCLLLYLSCSIDLFARSAWLSQGSCIGWVLCVMKVGCICIFIVTALYTGSRCVSWGVSSMQMPSRVMYGRRGFYDSCYVSYLLLGVALVCCLK